MNIKMSNLDTKNKRISKTLKIDKINNYKLDKNSKKFKSIYVIKDTIPKKINKLKSEINYIKKYNTLDITKEENEKDDAEHEKISSLKIKSKNNYNSPNNIMNDTDKYTNNKRNNANHVNFINGGNHKNRNNLKIIMNNKFPIKLKNFHTDIKNNYLTKEKEALNKNKNLLNTINLNETEILKSKKNIFNNEELEINFLKKELQKLKEENINNDNIINKLRNIINESQNKKEFLEESNDIDIDGENILLNEEINILNNNDIENKNIVTKKELNKVDETELFDKLRENYIYNKNMINQLINENLDLKNKINNNNNTKKKCKKRHQTQINNNKIEKENFEILSNKYNDEEINSDNREENLANNYVENSLKSNHRDCFMIKQMDDEQKNNTKLMLKMIINSNDIKKDEIISLFMNNLLDFYKTIEIFSSKYLYIINSPDIKFLKIYFKSAFFDMNKKLKIENMFNEINSFYDDEIKKFEEINLLDIYDNNKSIMNKILQKCKSKDILDTGLIEFSVFKNIFNEIKDKNEFKIDENEIFRIFLYHMKKNESKEQIGLFFLSYINICNILGIKDSLDNNFNEENKNSDDENYFIKLGEI